MIERAPKNSFVNPQDRATIFDACKDILKSVERIKEVIENDRPSINTRKKA